MAKPSCGLVLGLTLLVGGLSGCGGKDDSSRAVRVDRERVLADFRHSKDNMEDLRGVGTALASAARVTGDADLIAKTDVMRLLMDSAVVEMGRCERDLVRAIDADDAAGVDKTKKRIVGLMDRMKEHIDKLSPNKTEDAPQ